MKRDWEYLFLVGCGCLLILLMVGFIGAAVWYGIDMIRMLDELELVLKEARQ